MIHQILQWEKNEIKVPCASEGAEQGEIKNLCSDQDETVFKKTSGALPKHRSSLQYFSLNGDFVWSLAIMDIANG